MADKGKKKTAPTASVKGPNSSRRNGKAWKRRACGQRHEPRTCATCDAKTQPSPYQAHRAEIRAIRRDELNERGKIQSAVRKSEAERRRQRDMAAVANNTKV